MEEDFLIWIAKKPFNEDLKDDDESTNEDYSIMI